MCDWKGKVAVITGGSSGLGLTIARQLLAAGAHVVLAARDSQRLDQAAREVRAAGCFHTGGAVPVRRGRGGVPPCAGGRGGAVRSHWPAYGGRGVGSGTFSRQRT